MMIGTERHSEPQNIVWRLCIRQCLPGHGVKTGGYSQRFVRLIARDFGISALNQ
jgi:hypothetical protein